MGKIVRERYPDLSEDDQEAIRQHAVAAMNITQQAKLALAQADANGGGTAQGSTALLDGVRKFVNVRDLDIDLIDRINPFDAAYAVLAKAMDEKSLRQVQASIAAKKVSIPEDEARELAKRKKGDRFIFSRVPSTPRLSSHQALFRLLRPILIIHRNVDKKSAHIWAL